MARDRSTDIVKKSFNIALKKKIHTFFQQEKKSVYLTFFPMQYLKVLTTDKIKLKNLKCSVLDGWSWKRRESSKGVMDGS